MPYVTSACNSDEEENGPEDKHDGDRKDEMSEIHERHRESEISQSDAMGSVVNFGIGMEVEEEREKGQEGSRKSMPDLSISRKE